MAALRIVVLGSAAGGGVPQWNCRCAVCRMAWLQDGRVEHRTQSSLAVSSSGEAWAVVNCAPEILAQIKSSRVLHPRERNDAVRDSPIRSVLLTNGDIDHVAGLLSLREGQPFVLNATAEIHDVLRGNSVFGVLAEGTVRRSVIALESAFPLLPGLKARVFAVPGKTALYLEAEQVEIGGEGEATVGVEFIAGGSSAFYIPGCARLSDTLAARLKGAEVVLFDGTVWRDEEMIERGVGKKTGRRMGHMPISGDDGSIAAFAELGVKRKIFIHINNTNPILVEDSPERREAEAEGWEIARDGMEIAL